MGEVIADKSISELAWPPKGAAGKGRALHPVSGKGPRGGCARVRGKAIRGCRSRGQASEPLPLENHTPAPALSFHPALPEPYWLNWRMAYAPAAHPTEASFHAKIADYCWFC